MGGVAYTLSSLNRSLTEQGYHEWYLNCDWYGSPKTGIEPELTLILFWPTSSDHTSGTTYTLHWRASWLDATFSVPENTYKPQFQDGLLTVIPIGSQTPYFQQRGFLPLCRESVKAFFDDAYETTLPKPLANKKRFEAWRHLIALLVAQDTTDCPESSSTSAGQGIGPELESFLKELAAELRITSETAEQIWKDYHPEQKITEDEINKQLVGKRPLKLKKNSGTLVN